MGSGSIIALTFSVVPCIEVQLSITLCLLYIALLCSLQYVFGYSDLEEDFYSMHEGMK